MQEHPAEELIAEINSYLEKNRESLPVEEVELLERVQDSLQRLKTESCHCNRQPNWSVLGDIALRLTKFLADDTILEKFKDLL